MLSKLSLVNLIVACTSFSISAAELSDLYSRVSPSVVYLEAQDPFGNIMKFGTGFIIGDGCSIATNYHVVEGAFQLQYSIGAGEKISLSHYIDMDEYHDVAIVRTFECGIPLEFSYETPRIGQSVFTVGNPQGLNHTLSNGVISGVRDAGAQLLQTTTAISPGSSGGPLLNMNGAVVGMTTFYLQNGQNLNFAVPAQKISELLENGAEFMLADKFPNKRNPLSVAAAFFFAIRENDIEKAISYIEPRSQLEANEWFKERPTIPENAVLVVSEGHPIDRFPHAEVSIDGTSIGVDLVRYRDGWWVTK